MYYSPPQPAGGKNGSFSGSNAANRGIPHGHAKAPASVDLTTSGQNFRVGIRDGYIMQSTTTEQNQMTVTAIDDTNFYVGNAGDYGNSANASGATYYWVSHP